jgi:hypothetical protein
MINETLTGSAATRAFSKALVSDCRVVKSCLTKEPTPARGRLSNADFFATIPLRASTILGTMGPRRLRILVASAALNDPVA